MEELKADSRRRTKAQILVRAQACSETSFRIKERVLVIKETVRGPLTAVLAHGEVVLKGPHAPARGKEGEEKGK